MRDYKEKLLKRIKKINDDFVLVGAQRKLIRGASSE